jgi:arylsulfatase A-like enzyme
MHRILCAGFALACVAVSACEESPAGTAPPNVVFIYVDDLGWRDLGVQGSRYYETPNIDRLASQGMRFTQAYANAPNCAPSRAAVMSGRYAPRTGIYTVNSAARGRSEDRRLIPVENGITLDLDVVTVAEALSEAGYLSAHFGKWHLGGDGHLPTDQGFASNVGGDASGSPPTYFFPYERGGRAIPGLEEGEKGEYLTDRLVDESVAFLEQAAGGAPFFLYLSHFSVHTPIQGRPDLVAHYEGKAPADGQGNPAYAAMVSAVDEGVGRLLDTLDRLGLADNTVVIFTGDNGGHGPVTSMAPLRGAKGMLYEGGIREPMIVRWPGRVKAGTVEDTPVIGLDFYPTLLDLAGLDDAGRSLDGVSLVPLLLDWASVPERDLFWHFPAYLEATSAVSGPWRTTPVSVIRRGRFKLLYFFEDERRELYDLEADLAEVTDLAAALPEVAEELHAALEGWWAKTGAFIPTEANPGYVASVRMGGGSSGGSVLGGARRGEGR